MPSTYAHYRLGQQVRQALSGPQREAVEAWPALYLIGLHGPDILFYYHPLSSHPVKAVGHLLHGRPGRGFFRHACQVIRESQRPEAALAYAYGVLNHFALDMTCHPYVNGTAAAGDLTHTKIEVEFDRSLVSLSTQRGSPSGQITRSSSPCPGPAARRAAVSRRRFPAVRAISRWW